MTRPFCMTHVQNQNGSNWVSIVDLFSLFHCNYYDDLTIDSDLSFTIIGNTCSEDTIFVWIPLVALLLTTPIEAAWLKCHRSKKKTPLSLTIFYLCKMLAVTTLCLVSLARFIFWFLYADKNPLQTLDPWAPVLADALRAFSWLMIMILYKFNRVHNNLSSGSIFIFLVIKVVFNLYSTALLLHNIFDDKKKSIIWVTNHSMMITAKFIYVGTLYFLFFIECLSDDDAVKKKTLDKHRYLRERLISPEHSASFFAKLTFSWFGKLIKKKKLHQDDLWLLNVHNTSYRLSQSFNEMLAKQQNQKVRVEIMGILFRMYFGKLLWIALLKLMSTMFIFINPIVLDWIITFLHPDNKEPQWRGYFYASLMFLSPMMQSMLNNQHDYHINVITMRMKTCITSIIYNKSLRLANIAKQRFSTGEIINLTSVDTLRIVDLVNNINTLWSAPLQIVIGVYLLWLQLRYASLAGFSYMLIILPINILITNKVHSFQIQLMNQKDCRSKLLNEILNGIKVIKLNSWEKHFSKKISQFRNIEIKHLKYIAYFQTFMTTFFSSSAIFVALFSFLAYILISPDNILDANRAFVSLSLFNIIRIPLTFLPIFFSFAGITFVSIKRINEFLNSPEINDIDDDQPSMINDEKVAIKIKNGNFHWISDEPMPLINNVNLEIEKKSLVAIVGGVGSGKTSLLSAILGEMEKFSGQVEVQGRIAYVPQEPWIVNTTIRENIIMNKKYDEEKYRKVLIVCSLQIDLAMFPAGDMTEVGEKGVNLSGGQKQRISLARAIYANADIYILDNPLSALDVHVGQQIFDNVIGPKGALRSKTRLWVTTKLSLLTQADQIIYISRGEIKDKGTFNELIDNNGPFSEYVAEFFLDQQSGFETNLDDDDTEFIFRIEPKIQNVIERIQSTHNDLLSQNVSILESKCHSTFVSQTTDQSQSVKSSLVESNEIFGENATAIIQGRLIQSEEMAETLNFDNAFHQIYFRTIGTCICVVVLATFLLSNVFQIISSLWLSDWANDSIRKPEEINKLKRIFVFAALGILEALFTFFGTFGISMGCVRASKILHNQMINRIMQAPMSFFDSTPIGRIMNRFTRDIDIIDLKISTNLRLFVMQIFRIFVAFGLIGMETPIILIFLVPLTFAYYWLQKIFVNVSKQLKRIEAITRSPMNNHLSETINGTTSIRAYRLTKRFARKMLKRIDDNNQSYLIGLAAYRWLAVRLEFISYSVVFLASLFAILSRGSISSGVAGLAISYSLNITGILNLLILGYSELESNFVSLERIIEYMKTPKEKSLMDNVLARTPETWPFKGDIVFENYSTHYRSGLRLCLKRVNLVIHGGTKVAIVGRTGSGKSSLSLALARILEPLEGTIFIDNVNIRKITLETLRKSLTIIPQEPIIFTGTIRENVDTLGEYTNEEIIRALKAVNLNSFLENINYDINYKLNAGDNISIGQQQLICLARALLKQSWVVVFDEATASVDYETDYYINEVILSDAFKSKTVLTIAHRLDHVMNYDYVLVMERGEVAEFDNPITLASNSHSKFYSMAKEANLI